MSTRVEKGGAKFKPIIKAKARPSATPAPPDVRPNQAAESSPSMPPPSVIPIRAPSATPVHPSPTKPSPSTQLTDIGSVSGSQPSMQTTVIQPSRPKPTGNVISVGRGRSQTPALIVPSRNGQNLRPPNVTAVPVPAVQSQPSSIQTSQLATTQAPSAPIILTPSRPNSRSVPSNDDPGTLHLSAGTGSGDQPNSVPQKRPKLSILQAEEERAKKRPQRRAKNNKSLAETDDEAESDAEASGSENVPKRKRAPRKRVTDENTESGEAAEEAATQRKRTRVKRKTPVDEDGEGSGSEGTPAPRKRRRRSKTLEATLQEGTVEPIDPTQVTMGDICDDLGAGRVSSRFESSQILHAEAKKRAKEDRAQALIEASEHERTTGRPAGKRHIKRAALPVPKQDLAESTVENSGQNVDEFTYEEDLKTSQYAPQVRIGANGEVVLDADSLQVDRAADADNAEDYTHVEETDATKFTNSSTYSKKLSGGKWSQAETANFYHAVRQFGQQYDLIARVMPQRTYQMIKNKFNTEDKKNPAMIQDALDNPIPIDWKWLGEMTGRNFDGDVPEITAPQTQILAETVPATGGSGQAIMVSSGINGAQEEAPLNVVPEFPAERASTEARDSLPPADMLLEGDRASSPPLPETLLNSVGSSEKPGSTRLGPTVIGAPTRIGVLQARRVASQPPSTSTSGNNGDSSSTHASNKKTPGNNAQQDGMEVLGSVKDYKED